MMARDCSNPQTKKWQNLNATRKAKQRHGRHLWSLQKEHGLTEGLTFWTPRSPDAAAPAWGFCYSDSRQIHGQCQAPLTSFCVHANLQAESRESGHRTWGHMLSVDWKLSWLQWAQMDQQSPWQDMTSAASATTSILINEEALWDVECRNSKSDLNLCIIT